MARKPHITRTLGALGQPFSPSLRQLTLSFLYGARVAACRPPRPANQDRSSVLVVIATRTDETSGRGGKRRRVCAMPRAPGDPVATIVSPGTRCYLHVICDRAAVTRCDRLGRSAARGNKFPPLVRSGSANLRRMGWPFGRPRVQLRFLPAGRPRAAMVGRFAGQLPGRAGRFRTRTASDTQSYVALSSSQCADACKPTVCPVRPNRGRCGRAGVGARTPAEARPYRRKAGKP